MRLKPPSQTAEITPVKRPLLLVAACSLFTLAAEAAVALKLSARSVDCYDFVEVTLNVSHPPPGNPFTEAEVVGEFSREGGAPAKVDGFCDSEDGSVFRIRFMPSQPGRHSY